MHWFPLHAASYLCVLTVVLHLSTKCSVNAIPCSAVNSRQDPRLASACAVLESSLTRALQTANSAGGTAHVTFPPVSVRVTPSNSIEHSQATTKKSKTSSKTAGALPSTPSTGANSHSQRAKQSSSNVPRSSLQTTSIGPSKSTSLTTSRPNRQSGVVKPSPQRTRHRDTNSDNQDNTNYTNHVVIPAAVVCSIVGAAFIGALLWFCLRRRRREQTDMTKDENAGMGADGTPEHKHEYKPATTESSTNAPWMVQPLRHFRRAYDEPPMNGKAPYDDPNYVDESHSGRLSALREENEEVIR